MVFAAPFVLLSEESEETMEQGIKVCGVKSGEFACEAAERGVDFIGLIFDRASPRYVPVKAAKQILDRIPPFLCNIVGVFRDTPIIEILKTASKVNLDVIQLHGPYGADSVRVLKDLGFKVWLLDNGATPPETFGADGLIIDARRGSQVGGTGEVANWSRVAELKSYGIFTILAGGLGPDNIALASKLGADVLDLNSKLETSPGVKSIELLDAALAKI